MRRRVTRNPNVPLDLLTRASGSVLLLDLARHVPRVQKVFRVIAHRPDASAAVLELCLTDAQARPIAAAHPALPADRIVELLDEDGLVAAAAATNPSLPVSEIDRLTDLVP